MIITLCGSTRFKELYEEANLELTLRGWLVFSVGCYLQSDDKLLRSHRIDDDVKKSLDRLHKQKIAKSIAIMVLNKDGYIGNSTKSEIEYALRHNILVFYWEPHGIEDLEGWYKAYELDVLMSR